MRMAARKLLQHDGTNMVGGTAPSKSGIFPRALVGLWYFRWEERVIGFTSKESVEFGEPYCVAPPKKLSLGRTTNNSQGRKSERVTLRRRLFWEGRLKRHPSSRLLLSWIRDSPSSRSVAKHSRWSAEKRFATLHSARWERRGGRPRVGPPLPVSCGLSFP